VAKSVVLIVIDGLTPSVFERAVENEDAPALAFLSRHGRYARALSVFPSLTPVCAASIATGAHPDVHHIPHLVWFDREERRLVEYGSSFGAIIAAGTRRAIVDTIFNLSARHVSPARSSAPVGSSSTTCSSPM
jgi:predicted AlkP superfamily pyrophosphatase or phosphodiesterase